MVTTSESVQNKKRNDLSRLVELTFFGLNRTARVQSRLRYAGLQVHCPPFFDLIRLE
jgi:hypothetical protein